jgi:hypothetical protein
MSYIVSPKFLTYANSNPIGTVVLPPQIPVSSLAIPNIIVDDTLDTFPYPYKYNPLPDTVRYGVNADAILPQKYEYRYTNDSGIDVIIRGTYEDVMSTIDVLDIYKPIKNNPQTPVNTTGSKGRRQVNIFNNIPIKKQSPNQTTVVGTQDTGKHLLVRINNRVYSGSGSLIMCVETGKALDSAKIVLFRNSTGSGTYQDLGGKIDKPSAGTNVDEKILFTNAQKESKEESILLIDIKTESKMFVDIESTTSNTYYRVYLYLIIVNNLSELERMYEENKLNMLSNYTGNFDESYRETDKVGFFDYTSFVKKMDNYSHVTNVTHGVFTTVDGLNVNVSGRTIKVISEFLSNGIFNNLFSDNTLALTGNTQIINSFNRISF